MLSIANGQTYNVDHNVYDAKGMRLNDLVQGSSYDICVKESRTRKLFYMYMRVSKSIGPL